MNLIRVISRRNNTILEVNGINILWSCRDTCIRVNRKPRNITCQSLDSGTLMGQNYIAIAYKYVGKHTYRSVKSCKVTLSNSSSLYTLLVNTKVYVLLAVLRFFLIRLNTIDFQVFLRMLFDQKFNNVWNYNWSINLNIVLIFYSR